MKELYLITVVENNQAMHPLAYLDKDSLDETFMSLIDTYKLDKVSDHYRYVNLEQGIEVRAWNVRHSELSSASL